jgi:hypothetical protein
MSIDIFGSPLSSKEMQCNVYHDEREIPSKWLYHGFLFIPVHLEKEIIDMLAKERKESTWEKEIRFSILRDTRTMNALAFRWIKLFRDFLYDKTYFYFLGVNCSNLAKNLWDAKTRDFKIYNRFFQIGLYGAIKWFFLNQSANFKKVVIQNIFSDAKSRTPQDKFHSQPLEEIDFKALIKNEPILFKNDGIIEVDSDHYKETRYINQSHIIQYVDLIIGGISQVLDDTSSHEGKHRVAEMLVKAEIPRKIMGGRKFKSIYYKKYAVSFFPKNKLSKDEIINESVFTQKNQFYDERMLNFCNKDQLTFLGNC